MREKWLTIIILAAVGLVLVTFLVVFEVRASEVAVHRRGGRVLRAINAGDKEEAGWYFKLPWPIDKFKNYDKRVHVLDGKLAETALSDNRHVIISMYAGWRIIDPVKFENTLRGDEKAAEITLKQKIQDATSQTVGKFTLDNLVSADAKKLKFHEIEQSITDTVHEAVQLGDYGVDICSFGIRRIAIPEQTTERVFERMRSERRAYATEYRAAGDRIRTEKIEEAKTKREETIADAMAEGKRLRSAGEEAEAQYFSTFAKAPDLANFLRGLEALAKIAEEARNNRQPITFVVDLNTPPFDLLGQGRALKDYLAAERAAELTGKIADVLVQALSEGGEGSSAERGANSLDAGGLLRRLQRVSARTNDPELAVFVGQVESLVTEDVRQAEGSPEGVVLE